MGNEITPITKVAVFRNRKIRKVIFDNEWWFSVTDVVEALTDSDNPRDYWYKMKIREKDESGVQLSTICRQLKLESSGLPEQAPPFRRKSGTSRAMTV